MLLVHRPDGAEEQAFEVDFDDLDLEEIGLIESYSGKSYKDFVASFRSSSFGVLRPLLYVYLRRTDPLVHYRDVKPKLREVELRPSLGELLDMRERVEADPNFPDRKEVLAGLDEQIVEARARGESGKEEGSSPSSASANRRSRRSGTTTGSRSISSRKSRSGSSAG